MGFSLQNILDFLKKKNYTFSVVNKTNMAPENVFHLSSTRNKISNGIYFVTAEYIHQADAITQSIILTDSKEAVTDSDKIYIQVSNPQLVHYQLALSEEKPITPSIHPTAVIHPEAQLAKSVHIGPFCIIEKCVLEENVALLGHITVNDNCVIRKNSIVESHSVIGARGMAWIWDENGERVMQPQTGGVIIEDDCILGTDITIVRGSLSENTIIGKGTVMAHGTKIGHGCVIGKQVHFANNVSIAGNATIGDRVFLGSGCVVSSNVKVGEGCIIGAGAVVHKSIEETYCTIAGVPAAIIKRNNFEQKPKGAPRPFYNNKPKDEQ